MLLLCPIPGHAQGGVPLWTNRLEGDGPSGIVADSSGNVAVSGSGGTIKYSAAGVPLWTNLFSGAIAADKNDNIFVSAAVLNAEGDEDHVTIKYSNAGALLWTNRYDGQLYNEPGGSNDWAGPIAVDGDGNVLVTGSSGGGTRDYVTIKYSNTGVPLWTNRWNELGGYNETHGIAVDHNGNVFVTGHSGGNYNETDYATVAYSSGGDLLWVNRYDGPAALYDLAEAIAVDGNGNVFVTGRSAGDYATVAYSGAGAPLWENRYNGPGNGNDEAAAIAVDSNGNVFVTGDSYDTSGNQSFQEYVTIKYSPAGVPLWNRRYASAAGTGAGRAVAVDSRGNVFVTGYSDAGAVGATIAYSSAGVPLWTNRSNGGNLGWEPQSMAVDGSGNVFVAGSSYDGTNWGIVTIKYSSSILLPRLDLQTLNNQLVLSWTSAGFNLQTAPTPSGVFTTIPGATSPYTNSFTGTQQFYRLAQ